VLAANEAFSMKTIYILRHAKSSWSDPDLADLYRPLNDRGEQAAPFMGKLMAEKGYEPSIILSSTAVRARQTAELVRNFSGSTADIHLEDRIYEASPQALRQVISELDDAHASVLVVGHNPGTEGFIRYLSGAIEPMPTAALAVITLKIDSWEAIGTGCGTLEIVYRPKELLKRTGAEA
jgi:phosphohistidine phosphatase